VFAIILIDTFLLEPLKIFSLLLKSSLRVFYTLLDAIEGIEPEELDSEESGKSLQELQEEKQEQNTNSIQLQSKTNTYSSAAKQRLAWVQLGPHRKKPAGGTSGGASLAPAKLAPRGPLRAPTRPNYFHRRYTSRRSLSAALLDEQEHEPDD